jgi:deoxycytidine triphosphate deaminase
MIKIENECTKCPPELGCLGSSCPYISVPHYYCDFCKEESTLYRYNGYEICEECLLKQFEVVEESIL